MIILGLIVSLFIIVVAILLAGSNILYIVDPVSLLIILGIDAGVLAASGQLKTFARGVSMLFTGTAGREKNEILASAAVFDMLVKSSLAAGFIGLLVGAIIILSNLANFTQMGAALAVALLSVLYGLIMAFLLFLPAKYSLTIKAGRM